MELKIFNFIEEALTILESEKSCFEKAAETLTQYFKEILALKDEEYFNISTRVKSASSLKEKILRNSYYKKYTPGELISNLSDLIGVRIECRFNEDESEIYRVLKKHFNKVALEGYYYNSINSKIKLDLTSRQPQEQKNGFKIYRIDGIYEYNNRSINFELQIKSLVNMFWGEIEHKIIYKNYNFMAGNKLLAEVMGSIKNNLAMIDNQLNMMYTQINEMNIVNNATRKYQAEMLVSKMIFDIYYMRMKDSIGFIVDFRKSCDTIMKYIFRSNGVEDLEDYNNTLLKTFARLNEISKNDMDFLSEIVFERVPNFEEEFLDEEYSSIEFLDIVGRSIFKSINNDFQWNLFFRMLFEIELGNNTEDFETFVRFYKDRFAENNAFEKLLNNFEANEAEGIKKAFMYKLAYCFKEVDSIRFIYDDNIEEINNILDEFIDKINDGITCFNEWQSVGDIYVKLFSLRVYSIFDCNIKTCEVNDIIEEVKSKHCKIEISKRIFKYADKLVEQEEIKAEEAIKLFRIK
jgi:ppGpp synthetase/RelA/SpoT-type nucleotidyltranferase